MTVFYYDKEKAEQGILFCLGQEDKVLTQEEIKEQDKEELYKNVVTYTGESVLIGYPIIEGDTVRKATDKELIELGLLTLTDGEILEGDTIKKIPQPSWQYKWESPNWIVDRSKLQEGEKIEDNKIVKIEKPKGVRIEWNYDAWIYEDKATPEERKYYIGKYIGDELLMQVLAKGCEVTIREESHIQTLDSRKLLMLSSTGSGVLMAINSEQSLDTIPWSFNDDGSDSLVLTIDEFNSLALQCLDFVTKCYMVADILKAKDRIDLTIDDFIEELKK